MHDVREAQRRKRDFVRENQYRTQLVPYGKECSGQAGKFDDAPAWGSSAIICPWIMYQTYGDKKILSDNYETMKKYMAFLKGKEANGLVTYGLGDWDGFRPAGDAMFGISSAAVYVYDTGLMRDIASVLGNTDDSSAYAQDYTRVRDAYNRAYFDPKLMSYQPVKQANEAIPLVFGIVPEGDVEAVRQALVDDIAHRAPARKTDRHQALAVSANLGLS